MRNRVANYISKATMSQIKDASARKSVVNNISLCEKAMAELEAIYWFEKEFLIAIPLLINNASSFELVELLTVHKIYLKEHVKKLEQKFPFIHQIVLPKDNVA